MGLPIPEELPIVTAGAFTGHQEALADVKPPEVVWWLMLPVLIAGVVAGDMFLYFVGRRWGQRLLEKQWIRRRLPRAKQERIERNFQRYGIWILLFARMMPGLRSPIFLLAGVHRLPFIKFLIADGIYAIPGVSLFFFLAYIYTDQFVAVIDQAQKWRPIIALVVLTGVAIYLIRFFWKHPVAEGSPQDVPMVPTIIQVASHYGHPADKDKPKDKPNTEAGTRTDKPA
jgi:membrane protein DedA with SNARE-associated domain